MNDNRDDIVDDLIVRSLTGETTAEDEKELSAWIAQSQDNERHYLQFKKAFELSKSYNPAQIHLHRAVDEFGQDCRIC